MPAPGSSWPPGSPPSRTPSWFAQVQRNTVTGPARRSPAPATSSSSAATRSCTGCFPGKGLRPHPLGTYTVRLGAKEPRSGRVTTPPPSRWTSLSGAMAPRTILYTGKGGVGKTSVAAATARRCAAAGLRTVVLSTDPAHSLADVLETPVGSEPSELAPGLWAQQVSAQEELERHWSAVQGWLGQVLIDRGVERIAAEELTVPPGGDELFSLLRLKRHVQEGEWDVIVVDCAPTGETLRLLSFPEAARWWLGKLVGRET